MARRKKMNAAEREASRRRSAKKSAAKRRRGGGKRSGPRQYTAKQIAAGFGGKRGRITPASHQLGSGKKKRGKAKKKGKRRAVSKTGGSRAHERRITALEHSGAALHGALVTVVNYGRNNAGLSDVKRIPGYVSPLSRAVEKRAAKALPAGVRNARPHKATSGRARVEIVRYAG